MSGDTYELLRASIKTHWRLFGVLAGLILIAIIILSLYLPASVGIDWNETFRPAARELLALRNPYSVTGFFNPPWTLIPMLPLAVLPQPISGAAWFVLSLIMFAVSAIRLRARPMAVAAFIGSPLVMHSLLNGNIDWMVIFGFSLPPQIGLLFVLIKPQMGSIVSLFWLVESWRNGRGREVVRVFWPITVAGAASMGLFGFWPASWSNELSLWWNASLWPVSIPVGLALTVAAIRTRKIQFAMSAAPCLSPYVLFHAWSGALAAVLTSTAEMLAAVAGLWLLVLIRATS